MRSQIIALSLAITSVATCQNQAIPSSIDLAPYQQKINNAFLTNGATPEQTQKATQALGLNTITHASQTTQLVNGAYQSTLTLKRPQRGIFQCFGTPSTDALPFYAPASTDIALQLSLDLSHFEDLYLAYHSALNQRDQARAWLDQPIGSLTLAQHLKELHPRLHLTIDFEDDTSLNLGNKSIGRPQCLLRIDGMSRPLEKLLQHYVKTRGVPFKKNPAGNYQLPAYLAEAMANYLPVIRFNHTSDQTIIASSTQTLERMADRDDEIVDDPNFLKTWQPMPARAHSKLYISKRAVHGFRLLFQQAMKEKWTDNPIIIENKLALTAAVNQLDATEFGLAFALVSDEKQDTLHVHSPIPLSLFLWFLAK
ncbi:hypothetical protein [Rubritalea tangerina]|uniref:Uncharacterized protein n=1 Tax=Rubritalea tangerina TaxID=430798 RepID=A0ABW4ZC12_9BACT